MNLQLLKARMVEKGVDDTQIASALGINISTLYRKKSGESDFYRKEIQIIKMVLNLSDEDVRNIFFADCVA
ncbi:MAG: hypothetical protein IJ120_05880 [Solobacterium sp.]|nr:hypothetical protein [Solobacterium sp.]